MKHTTTIAVIVAASELLATACLGASAQGFDARSEPHVMAYYAIPFGARNREAGEPVLGLRLERRDSRRPSSPLRLRTEPPPVDLTVSVRSGAAALRLHGRTVDLGGSVLKQDGKAGSGSDLGVGAVILVGAGVLIAVALANNAKSNFEECLQLDNC